MEPRSPLMAGWFSCACSWRHHDGDNDSKSDYHSRDQEIDIPRRETPGTRCYDHGDGQEVKKHHAMTNTMTTFMLTLRGAPAITSFSPARSGSGCCGNGRSVFCVMET